MRLAPVVVLFVALAMLMIHGLHGDALAMQRWAAFGIVYGLGLIASTIWELVDVLKERR